MFLNELIVRLKRYYSADSSFRLSFTGALPLSEYFTLIDQHFEVGPSALLLIRGTGAGLTCCFFQIYRKKLKLHDVLAQKAAQFRAAERQLLLKLNEAVPSPMAHVDALIEMTYRQVRWKSHVDRFTGPEAARYKGSLNEAGQINSVAKSCWPRFRSHRWQRRSKISTKR